MTVDARDGAGTPSRRLPWAIAWCFLAAGCSHATRYEVTGRVLGWQDGAPVPLQNAEVSVGPEKTREWRPTTTRSDGTFQLVYIHQGAVWFRVWDGNPVVDVRAPGHLPCAALVRSDDPTPGVTRGRCSAIQACYTIDVVLTPEDAGEVVGSTATCK